MWRQRSGRLGCTEAGASLPAGRVRSDDSLVPDYAITTPAFRNVDLTCLPTILLCSAPAPFVTRIMPFGAECSYLVCMHQFEFQ